MAEYTLVCQSCGELFQAVRRHAKTCSKRCRNRLRLGSALPDNQTPKALTSSAAPPANGGGFERVYALYRGRLDQVDMLSVNRLGLITSGVFAGLSLREVLQTAAREGWLAYRRRPDGWYSAEFADGHIALCGPVKSLPGARFLPDAWARSLAPTIGNAVCRGTASAT
jgi:hypothetical protein